MELKLLTYKWVYKHTSDRFINSNVINSIDESNETV